jgi:glycosyltransferase involved in cell wall biosynthesis
VLRIAMVSTPFVAVPPPRYGGTELVVSELVNGLVALGHEVVLFATPDSRAPCELRSLFDGPVWPPEPHAELAHAAWSAEQIARDRRRFDVVHAHVPASAAVARLLPGLPHVYTMHHDRQEALATYYETAPRNVRFVAISERQRKLYPELDFAAVVHHGLDPRRYPVGADGGYLAFLGRYSHDKGPDVAVDVAQATRLPLFLGGAPHWEDGAFFRDELAPRLELPGVKDLGALAHDAKVTLLTRARALLFPVRWEEPFGLVMIESMFCGTPVVCFGGGAVPEVVDEGVTGFIARDAGHMARLVRDEVPRLSREGVRRRAVERFSTGRMVRRYLEVYGAPPGAALEEGAGRA